jgi:hypothetical protein
MIQRLELFLLQSARLNIAMSVSELILVLFQTSAAFLRYYFASVFLGYFRKSEAFFVVFAASMQSQIPVNYFSGSIDFFSFVASSSDFRSRLSLLQKRRVLLRDASTPRCLP